MRVRIPAPFLDCDISYEERVATIEAGLAASPEQAADLLRLFAERHPDNGVRFNAVQMMIKGGRLDPAEAARLPRIETAPDLQLLLEDALDR